MQGHLSENKQPWELTKKELLKRGLNLRWLDSVTKGKKADRITPYEGFYYHVVKNWDGQDILSAEKRGITPEEASEKWPEFEGYGSSWDYFHVSLFNELAAAEEFKESFWNGKATILKIKLDEDADVTPNEEGYPSVRKVSRDEIIGETSHKQVVQEALSVGKPVPPEVLAEYPELVEKKGHLLE